MTVRRLALASLALAGLAPLGSCDADDLPSVVVHLNGRPTTRAAQLLEVTLTNAELTVPVTFDVTGRSFPQSFSVTPEGRGGLLDVLVVARPAADDPLTGGGRARGSITLSSAARLDLELFLEPDDFVVNSRVTGDEYLTYVDDASGRQVAVLPDGTFFVTFENSCPSARCDILARRFSPNTLPARNDDSGDSGDFIASIGNGTYLASAVDGNDAGVVVAYCEQVTGKNIAYHPRVVRLSKTGAHLEGTPIEPSLDPRHEGLVDVAMVGTTGHFVVVWQRELDDGTGHVQIVGRLYGPDGQPRANGITGTNGEFPIAESTNPAESNDRPYVVGTSNGEFVVVWRRRSDLNADVDLVLRRFNGDGMPRGGDVYVTTGSGEEADGPRAAALPDGGVAVTWEVLRSTDPTRMGFPILMRRFDRDGAPIGAEVVVQDTTTAAFSLPAVAVRADGSFGVTWTECEPAGDGDSCAVWLARLDDNAIALGPPIIANTTVSGIQDQPSIAALGEGYLVLFRDDSQSAPDNDGQAVRGRVIYDPTE